MMPYGSRTREIFSGAGYMLVKTSSTMVTCMIMFTAGIEIGCVIISDYFVSLKCCVQGMSESPT